MTFYTILGLSVFLISLLGTRLTILALRKRTLLLDIPNARSNHTRPVPRGGGIAVLLSLIIGLLIADGLDLATVNYGLVLAMFLLGAVSLLDDLIGVPAFVRLIVQLLAVSVTLVLMPHGLFAAWLPNGMDKAITAILWIWFTNLFNFMDGIDGLTVTEMICIGGGICFLTAIDGTFAGSLAAGSLILAVAGCGFLWWNWHPAKIFLGDVGSVPIGFFAGYLLLLLVQAGYGYAAAILPGYYLADSTITLLKRLHRSEKIWVAHSEHYYQKAVRKGRRHDTVSRYVFGLNLLLILLAVMTSVHAPLAGLYLAVAYLLICMLLGFFAHTHSRQPHEPF